jgi:hypothetical protein
MKQQPLSEGMPPSKQQQHEEALAPLDDQERRAVQKRLMRRNHGSGVSATARSTDRDRYAELNSGRNPAGRRSARGAYSSRSAMTTGRSMMTTARSSSPTGRYHPDPTRRLEIRKVCTTLMPTMHLRRHAHVHMSCVGCGGTPLSLHPVHLSCTLSPLSLDLLALRARPLLLSSPHTDFLDALSLPRVCSLALSRICPT